MEQAKANNNQFPTVMVILGGTGDLMRRKLAPGLFHLYREGRLPKLFAGIGFSRDSLSKEEFQNMVGEMIAAKTNASSSEISSFTKAFSFQQGLFDEKEGYKRLAEFLGLKDKEWQVCSNKLFYLAVPPQHYKVIFQNLASSGLTEPCSPEEGWTRVIVEKPFGKDLKTAQQLDRMLGKLFKEEQIYRMDHYLGKETVQNILAFRFSNSFLDPAWNNKWIESVSIRLLEQDGIGERGAFYDGIGALRDVGQNHMLQLLALFLMENPGSFEGDAVRQARAEVFKSLQTLKGKSLLAKSMRGQYQGYTKEQHVATDSATETYFRIVTSVNNPRWKGVLITLESGKALRDDLVEVQVVFRHPTQCLCPDQEKHYKNILHYTIEPDEGARLKFWVKKPGPTMQIEGKDFVFNYKEAFQGEEFQDAYERLLWSIIQGDQTLFVSTEEIMASWKFVDSILRGWQQQQAPLAMYPRGASIVEL